MPWLSSKDRLAGSARGVERRRLYRDEAIVATIVRSIVCSYNTALLMLLLLYLGSLGPSI